MSSKLRFWIKNINSLMNFGGSHHGTQRPSYLLLAAAAYLFFWPADQALGALKQRDPVPLRWRGEHAHR